VYYDQGTGGSFVLLKSDETTKSYQTTSALTAGLTYKFKVRASNSVGQSVDSAVLAVLSARVPDAPVSLSN